MVCGFCNKDIKYGGEEYTYMTKGIKSYKQYDICEPCIEKFFGLEEVKNKALLFLWSEINAEQKTVRCIPCGNLTKEDSLHTIAVGKGIDDLKWYNFCDDCAKEKYNDLIMFLNLAGNGELVVE